MKNEFAAAWKIAKPYWVSEDRWPARGLLLLLIGIDLAKVYTMVRMSFWHKDFWDALAAFDVPGFWKQMLVFLVIAIVAILLDTAKPWFNQKLEMRWRNWVTDVYLQRYLSDKAYYHLDREHAIDNPDQRVSEDLRLMASNTLTMFLGFISNFANLVSYSAIIWSLSAPLAVAVGGFGFDFHGYLFWAAALYGLVGTLLVERIGRRLVRLDNEQQRREADFRFLMMRIRQSAEQIAFYRGEGAERSRLGVRFQAIRENWRGIMKYTKRVTLFNESYVEFGAIVIYLMLIPRYFTRELSLGMVQQGVIAFGRARGAFAWFVYQYKELALLRSVYQRLVEFDAALSRQHGGGIAVGTVSGAADLRVSGLDLALPDGAPLGRIDDLTVSRGERWLVRGASGEGKSTLMRALAGIWPHGHGRVSLPDARMMFVPQQSYVPIGTLREAVCYPDSKDAFDDRCIAEALRAVRLEHLIARLDVAANWSRQLSQGEQQRLAFARVLLQRPDYLFMDESTSALDEDNEHHLYRLLLERLPGLTLVSVAHRTSLRVFHDRCLEFKSGTCRKATLDGDRSGSLVLP